MNAHEHAGPFPDGNAQGTSRPGRVAKEHSKGRWLGIVLLLLVLLGLGGRALLPSLVRHYVNRTLDRNLLYAGRIGEINVHLLRGAYTIHEVHISQRTGNVPVPLLTAKRVDFSVQWDALLHGRVVGRFLMDHPELNFVASSEENQAQTGFGGPWLQMIRDLFPFQINSAAIQEGTVHFRDYQTPKPVDIYLSHLNGSIDDLSNIRNETAPLIAKVHADAQVMDQAKLELKMTLDPFSYRPTFHLAVRLLGLDVTKINDLALAYGKLDFKRGWFDLVLEADSKEGRITGYVKPLFRNLRIFSLTQDLKEDAVLQFFWQALMGGVTSVLKNFPRDQFGTLIPFTGDVSGTTPDILSTVANILRNAFVRAYLPKLQPSPSVTPEIQFEAPDFTQSLSSTANETQ